MEQLRTTDYYTTTWSYPDVIMRLSGVEGPVCNPESQTIVDFAGQVGVKACVEDQWHPPMWQGDSVLTATFEVPAGMAVPVGLHSYLEN